MTASASNQTDDLPSSVSDAFSTAALCALQELMQIVACMESSDAFHPGVHQDPLPTPNAHEERSKLVDVEPPTATMPLETASKAGVDARDAIAFSSSEQRSPTTSANPSLDQPLIIATIQLAREVPGYFFLLLSTRTAEQLAARYLGPDIDLSPELIDDLAGEMANVIAGQAKTMLKGTPYHFHMTTPTIRRNTARQFALQVAHTLPRPLCVVCEAGPLYLHVQLTPIPQGNL